MGSYTRQFYLTSRRFSVAALIDTAGNVVERYTYSPYGQRTVLSASFNPKVSTSYVNYRGFLGLTLDSESALIYNRNRILDPNLGRFLQRDPLGYVDGMSQYRAYFVPDGMDPYGNAWWWIIPAIVVLAISVILPKIIRDYLGSPGGHRPLTPEEDLLTEMKDTFAAINNVDSDHPAIADIKNAIRDCPISGIFVEESPDGAIGSSVTTLGSSLGTHIYLGKDFFTKPKCDAYKTLVKECYQRAVLRDDDDSGMSDRRSNANFLKLECALACCGHENPHQWPEGGTSCCPGEDDDC